MGNEEPVAIKVESTKQSKQVSRKSLDPIPVRQYIWKSSLNLVSLQTD